MSVPVAEQILTFMEEARDEYKVNNIPELRSKQEEREYVASYLEHALSMVEQMDQDDEALALLDAAVEEAGATTYRIDNTLYMPAHVAVGVVADLLK